MTSCAKVQLAVVHLNKWLASCTLAVGHARGRPTRWWYAERARSIAYWFMTWPGQNQGVTNRIQTLLGVQYPVVQAPMTYIARAELAAAVSEGGGLGMIETLTPEGRADLRRVLELTDRPVGANLMIQGWKRDPSIVDELVAAEVRHVFTSAGDPALFTSRLHDAGMTVTHVIGSLKGAMKAVDAGVDALVVEGVEGGGFKSALGASTLVLLPLVADRVDLPIIAAGGICDARSAAAAVVLGAEGVQMGTRMLASHEAGVHANFKNEIIAAGDDGTVMLDLPGNPTMRVLRTGLAARVAAAEPGIQLLGRITDLYFDGDMEASVANTGQVSSRITELQPAAKIVEQTWSEIEKALSDSRSRARQSAEAWRTTRAVTRPACRVLRQVSSARLRA